MVRRPISLTERGRNAPPRTAPRATSEGGASAVGGATNHDNGVPRIDAVLAQRVRVLYQRGRARGMRGDVFAKLGDSITESASFLQDIGHGWAVLGPEESALTPTITFFRATRVDGEGNDSFAHGSGSAVAGWTAADALDGSPTPVERELDALRPAWALVMFGTNDVERSDPRAFRAQLGRILDLCEQRGVVAIPSTIPPRRDSPAYAARVPAFNAVIIELARARQLPLIDLHAVLASAPSQGLDEDGIHPSAFRTRDGDVQAANFTAEALRHGYNLRNLITLRTLARLRDIVTADGASDQ